MLSKMRRKKETRTQASRKTGKNWHEPKKTGKWPRMRDDEQVIIFMSLWNTMMETTQNDSFDADDKEARLRVA